MSSAAFGELETPESLTTEQIDARARELLAQLTLDEKLGLMDGDTPFWQGLSEMMSPGGYSSRCWVAGAVPRLGIPGIRFADGPRGIVLEGATTFPVSMARGATFDPALEERVGDVIGRELRALGGNFFGGVCINLLRHPAWGRAQETYGEDPRHLAAMGAALVRGVQRHVMACAKHYALNSMENARFQVDVTIDGRALREVYLPHFRACVEEGVASVMSAYNSVNGEWCGQNRMLLTDILKKEMGFDGFTITDFIFGMRDSKKAALAGQDTEMPFAMYFSRDLKGLVERGEVPLERIDDAVLRKLRQLVRFGQGRDPGAYGREVVGSAEHRQLALEVARKSIVLLKNEGGLLPLHRVRRLLVVGALGDTPNTGDGGSSNTQPAYVITPLQGLQDALGHHVVEYDDGSEPARAAQQAAAADAVLLVLGYTHADEGEYIPPDMLTMFLPGFPAPRGLEQPIAERIAAGAVTPTQSAGGDRVWLGLHRRDEALIEAVAAANPRTVVAVMAGSAVLMESWRSRVPAIVMLWYPGMEGGRALADVLLGKVNPSGRLPCTFPASTADLPYFDPDATEIRYDLWHGYRKLEREDAPAAFPFGFGLSYTKFEHADLRLDRTQATAGARIGIDVDVTNTGAVAGEEVVQVYVEALASRVLRAPKELKTFARVALEAGETRTVHLELPAADLAYWDATAGWIVEPIEYEVAVMRHAADDTALRARFRVA